MYSTMTRSKRLSPVLKLAETNERSAAQSMAQTRQRLHYYEEKLTELCCFRKEYANSLHAGQANAISASQLQEYQSFLRQLDKGISVISEKISGQKQLNTRDEQQWLMAKQRTDALDKLVLKLQGMERNLRDNREANEVDERSQHQKSRL